MRSKFISLGKSINERYSILQRIGTFGISVGDISRHDNETNS